MALGRLSGRMRGVAGGVTLGMVGALCLLGGCSADGGSGASGPPDMATPTAAELLAERPYSVATVPPGYSDAQRWPLVIVLAGFGSEGSDTAAWLGFSQLSADQGFFLVAPDPDALHARFAWDPSPTHFPNFDVEYLTAIIHDVEAHYAIDAKRVYVVGHSLGAHMAHRMACDDAADVAAIASFAGQVTKDPAGCVPTQPVSVVQIHGTADQTIGYYGDLQDVPPDPSVPSAHETVAVWARNDVCTGAIAATGTTYDLVSDQPGAETTVEAYAGCPTGVSVELWSIQGGTHRPPVTASFAPTVWSFLTAHARP